MTQERALQLYNQAKGDNITMDDLRRLPDHVEIINDIIKIDEMCQRMGGSICSRQTIAMIIHFSEKFYD